MAWNAESLQAQIQPSILPKKHYNIPTTITVGQIKLFLSYTKMPNLEKEGTPAKDKGYSTELNEFIYVATMSIP